MQTKIIITHISAADLKAHPIWKQIMDLLMDTDKPVFVEEIELIDNGEQAE